MLKLAVFWIMFCNNFHRFNERKKSSQELLPVFFHSKEEKRGKGKGKEDGRPCSGSDTQQREW